jgi:SAM-dependent methyltransferase
MYIPTARRNGMSELLDGDSLDRAALAANLREIRMINAGLGWTAISARLIERLVRRAKLSTFSYLDVATGSGDLPRAVLRRARRRGWTVQATALDLNPDVLAEARAYLADQPVALRQGDACALPFPDRSVDVVSCALALHHFAPEAATQALREVARVARHAWLVVDLERSLPAYLGARALWPLLRSPVTRQDAPASVLRAYTLPELRALLERAGLGAAYAATRFPFRLVAASAPPWPRRGSGTAAARSR